MNNKITKPLAASTENSEYYYRHPEMYRARIDDDDDLLLENVTNFARKTSYKKK